MHVEDPFSQIWSHIYSSTVTVVYYLEQLVMIMVLMDRSIDLKNINIGIGISQFSM